MYTYLVQLGNDLLIILGSSSQLCQMNLLFPLFLLLYLQIQDENCSAVAVLHGIGMYNNNCCKCCI